MYFDINVTFLKKMSLSKLLDEKRKASRLIKDKYGFLIKIKPVWFINLADEEKVKALTPALEVLPCNFVIAAEGDSEAKNIAFDNNITADFEIWFDFVVWDENFEDYKNLFSKWVAPILPQDCSKLESLEEFNPLDTSWVCYKYMGETHYHIFYTLVKYLENYKFPYDNRNLIKNIIELKL